MCSLRDVGVGSFCKNICLRPRRSRDESQLFRFLTCKQKISLRSRGLHELKHHLWRNIIWGLIRCSMPVVIIQNYIGWIGAHSLAGYWKQIKSCLNIYSLQNRLINGLLSTMSMRGSVRELYSLDANWTAVDLSERRGHWCILEDYWTQMGVLTGLSAGTADFIRVAATALWVFFDN